VAVAALVFLVFNSQALFAAEKDAAPPTAGSTHLINLELCENKSGPLNWDGLSIRRQNTVFKKEPALGQNKVARGFLCFGGQAGRDLPFIWDQTRRRLYLDVNRNQDFTDDSSAAYEAGGSGPPVRADFSNVRIPFQTGGADVVLVCSLNLYQYAPEQIGGSVIARSFWAGKLVLEGKDWQVGLVPNLSFTQPAQQGFLLLRPWSERDEPIDTQNSCTCLPWPGLLFFDGRAYATEATYTPQNEKQNYTLKLTPKDTELGELKLTGRFIRSLALLDRNRAVILNSPEPVVKVPTGAYAGYRVCLKAGTNQAFLKERFYGKSNLVEVTASRQVVLAVGGPLTNCVVATRLGRNLNLTYRLAGEGEREYQIAGPRLQPEFVAYRGDKKVATGKFEFG
jgi:hypothetical protein